MKVLILLLLVTGITVGETNEDGREFASPFGTFFHTINNIRKIGHVTDEPTNDELTDEYNYEQSEQLQNRGWGRAVEPLPDLRRCVRCMAFCRSHNLVCVTGCLTTLSCVMKEYKVELGEPDDESLIVVFEQKK